jgi:hypothetical protein
MKANNQIIQTIRIIKTIDEIKQWSDSIILLFDFLLKHKGNLKGTSQYIEDKIKPKNYRVSYINPNTIGCQIKKFKPILDKFFYFTSKISSGKCIWIFSGYDKSIDKKEIKDFHTAIKIVIYNKTQHNPIKSIIPFKIKS